MKYIARLIVVIAVLVAMSGCSTVKIAYNQADHIAAWTIDDYFELDAEQKAAFKSRFERFHAWHRSTQLPEYAELLESAHQRVSAGASPIDAEWLSSAFRARLETITRHTYQDAALFLSRLSDDQIAAARKEMDKRNRKFARERGLGASEDEQRRLQATRQIERIEQWTGPLSAAQEAKVRAMSRGLPLITELRHQERLRRQDEFLALMQQRRNVDTFAPRLRDWVIDWDKTRPAAYQRQHARFMQESSRMYLALLDMLTPEQRQHVLSVIRRYQQSFRELAAQVPRQQSAQAQ
jgi:hypothetical protein